MTALESWLNMQEANELKEKSDYLALEWVIRWPRLDAWFLLICNFQVRPILLLREKIPTNFPSPPVTRYPCTSCVPCSCCRALAFAQAVYRQCHGYSARIGSCQPCYWPVLQWDHWYIRHHFYFKNSSIPFSLQTHILTKGLPVEVSCKHISQRESTTEPSLLQSNTGPKNPIKFLDNWFILRNTGRCAAEIEQQAQICTLCTHFLLLGKVQGDQRCNPILHRCWKQVMPHARQQ